MCDPELWRLFSDASVFLGSTGHQLRGSERGEGLGGLKREEGHPGGWEGEYMKEMQCDC